MVRDSCRHVVVIHMQTQNRTGTDLDFKLRGNIGLRGVNESLHVADWEYFISTVKWYLARGGGFCLRVADTGAGTGSR